MKVKQLQLVIEETNKEIEDTKARRTRLRVDVEAIKGEIQRKSIEQNTARLNISQARERMEEEAGSAASLRTESAEIEGQIREIKKN